MIFKETGQHHPAYLRKPALRSDCIRYHDAYCHLGASRIYGQAGPCPIAVSETLAYLEVAGIEETATRLKYLRLIQRMDRVELKHINEKVKRTSK